MAASFVPITFDGFHSASSLLKQTQSQSTSLPVRFTDYSIPGLYVPLIPKKHPSDHA